MGERVITKTLSTNLSTIWSERESGGVTSQKKTSPLKISVSAQVLAQKKRQKSVGGRLINSCPSCFSQVVTNNNSPETNFFATENRPSQKETSIPTILLVAMLVNKKLWSDTPSRGAPLPQATIWSPTSKSNWISRCMSTYRTKGHWERPANKA